MPSSGASCTLPSLGSEGRYGHTASEDGLLCGGAYDKNSCLQWKPDTGSWEDALTLGVGREYHVSWTPKSGITGTYLMGGIYSKETTTLITPDGESQELGFLLKYDAE